MYKAVIFDLNGVIVDDEKHHQQSWRELAKKHGIALSEEDLKHNITGRRTAEALEFLFKRKLTAQELEQHSSQRFELVKDLVDDELELTPGLESFLIRLQNEGVSMAIATGSRTRYFDLIMERFNLRHYFQVVTTAEEVEIGKPDPQVYLITAQKLGVEPKDCLVFEDSISGIKSAKAAGMKVIAITTTHSGEELELADQVIDTFENLDI